MIEMGVLRRQERLRLRLDQEASQQRAAFARKLYEQKIEEIRARVVNGETSLTEAQQEVLDATVDRVITKRNLSGNG
jgi:hypothetical protein